jgi:hypothetical protein
MKGPEVPYRQQSMFYAIPTWDSAITTCISCHEISILSQSRTHWVYYCKYKIYGQINGGFVYCFLMINSNVVYVMYLR